jgi:transcriptional regulator with XRE-family HTH domain
MTKNYGPYYGRDLEAWRLKHNLKKEQAAELLGLQILRWKLLTTKRKDEIIDDLTLCQLLSLFEIEPKSLPITPDLEISDFYYLHGFSDSPEDRKEFAILIGRSVPSVYRLLKKTGNPSKQVTKWIEAVNRLGFRPDKAVEIMKDISEKVAEAHKNAKVKR